MLCRMGRSLEEGGRFFWVRALQSIVVVVDVGFGGGVCIDCGFWGFLLSCLPRCSMVWC